MLREESQHDAPQSALLEALKRAKPEVARRLLLEQPASWSQLETQDEDQDGAALFWACVRGYYDLVELLLTLGAKVNGGRTSRRCSALHAAADRGRLRIVRLLLQWGANLSARSDMGDTPAHHAAYRGHTEVVSCLAEAGANLRATNQRGNDVIHEAMAGNCAPNKMNATVQCIQRFLADS